MTERFIANDPYAYDEPGSLPYCAPHFVGRTELLTTLHNLLVKERRVALTPAQPGLEGVGRRQLALQYCRQYSSEYQQIWWIYGAEPARLAYQYAHLAHLLGLPEAVHDDQQVRIAAVTQWLAQHDGWLLIFDHAPTAAAVEPYLPPAATGHLLITTDEQDWGGLAETLPVPLLQRDEAIALIGRRMGAAQRATDKEVEELAHLLSDWPLALELAGAYMEATGISVPALRDLLAPHRASVVDAVCALACERLERESPLAHSLLGFCAFLAPEAIPHALLQQFVAESASESDEPPTARLQAALTLLQRYALVGSAASALFIHRTVQTAIRMRLAAGVQNAYATYAIDLLWRALPDQVHEVATWPRWAALLPHVLVAAAHAQGAAPALVARLLDWTGGYLVFVGRYTQAKHVLEQSLAACWQTDDMPPLTEAEIVQNLFNACYLTGAFREAFEHAQNALRLYAVACPHDNRRLATALVNLADCAVRAGEWDAARRHAEQARQWYERLADHADLQIGNELHNLAWVHDTLGDRESALRLYLHALQLTERIDGPEHPSVIATAGNIGEVLRGLGRLTEARPYTERALRLAQLAYGEKHADVATALHNMGALLSDLGDLSAAHAHFQRALTTKEQVYGREHPEVAFTCRNLGTLCLKHGDTAGALRYVQRALEINRRHSDEASDAVQEDLRLLKQIPHA